MVERELGSLDVFFFFPFFLERGGEEGVCNRLRRLMEGNLNSLGPLCMDSRKTTSLGLSLAILSGNWCICLVRNLTMPGFEVSS